MLFKTNCAAQIWKNAQACKPYSIVKACCNKVVLKYRQMKNNKGCPIYYICWAYIYTRYLNKLIKSRTGIGYNSLYTTLFKKFRTRDTWIKLVIIRCTSSVPTIQANDAFFHLHCLWYVGALGAVHKWRHAPG